MRLQLPVGRLLFFTAVFVIALLALLPMRLVIDGLGWDTRGIAARDVRGSIWGGELREAQLSGVAAGDVHAALRALPLLIGTARVGFERSGDGPNPFDGAIEVGRTSFGLADVDGPLSLGAALAPLPLSQLDLAGLTARFEDGQCSEAGGTVRAQVAGDLGGISLPGGLTGTARCDSGALLIPMASQSGMEQLELRVFADGRFQASIIIRSTDTALQPRLQAAGFQQSPQGWTRTVSGRL